jgi:hypothetical protein
VTAKTAMAAEASAAVVAEFHLLNTGFNSA